MENPARNPNELPTIHRINPTAEEGGFVPFLYFDARLVGEVFRRRVLERLHCTERLSEAFLRSLLGWVHSGFSVLGGQTVPTDESRWRSRSSISAVTDG